MIYDYIICYQCMTIIYNIMLTLNSKSKNKKSDKNKISLLSSTLTNMLYNIILESFMFFSYIT